MSQSFPTSELKFLRDENVQSFDLDLTSKSDDFGYILEVDLQYLEHLHDTHSDNPLATEKLPIAQHMFFPYSASFINKHIPGEKLSPNLNN